MVGTILVLSMAFFWLVMGFALAAELRRQTVNALWADLWGEIRLWRVGWGYLWEHHPKRGWAIVETVLWSLMIFPLLDHLLHTEHGWTAYWVWVLTIIQHEGGHLICSPFGWFLMVAGGSIWQVLFWVLAGWFAIIIRRQLAGGLFCWMLAGHSFINMSIYIRDAQERELPLLFGLGKEAHDWWNLLNAVGLLPYDNLIGDMAEATGALLVLVCIGLGLLTTWYLPHWQWRLVIFPLGELGQAITHANQQGLERPTLEDLVGKSS